MFQSIPPKERFPRAREAAGKALQLDDSLAMAHATIGYISLLYDWDWTKASKELRRAIELNPGYATAHSMYARYLTITGRFDEALAAVRRALDYDPLSLSINTGLASTYYFARRFTAAVEQYQKTLELEPKFSLAQLDLGRAYTQLARYSEAIAMFSPAAEADDEEATILLAYTYARMDQRTEAESLLRKMSRLRHGKYISPYVVAFVYTGLGDKERALALLEEAYTDRAPNTPFLRVQPEFDPIRSEPRYSALLTRLNLP